MGISKKKLSEVHEKLIKDAEDLKKSQQDLRDKEPDLTSFVTLEKRWRKYDLSEDEILELGVKGTIRFFVKIQNVTICWLALYGDPPGDLCGLRDIKDHTPFQVTKLSIEDIWCSMDYPKKTSDIQLVCIDELKVGYDKIQEDNLPAPDRYVSEICQYKGSRESEPDSHVLAQSTRRVMDLWVAVEDVKRYEADRLLIEGHPTKTEHSHKQLTPSQQEDLTSSSELPYLNRDKLESFFNPASWNTIKAWAIKFGIPKPEPGKKWEITINDANDIRTKQKGYFETKKIGKSKNKF